MAKILVAGLINVETTLQIDGFPIEYFPVRYPFFGVRSTISGVGFNIAKALTTLGDQVSFLSVVGSDIHRIQVYQSLSDAGIDSQYIVEGSEYTPQSIILYDPNGRRQIHVDLKDYQNIQYPQEKFDQALSQSSLAVLCNINFSRRFLSRAKLSGIPIASDVHSISSLDDEYNKDYIAAADILFCSDESLPCPPDVWTEQVFRRYGANIVVIGLGAKGAYLAVRNQCIREHIKSIYTRPVINTIGAGDALFSCFLHYYLTTKDAVLALNKAMVFASYKIGERGAADGFLSERDLEIIYTRTCSD